MVVNWSCLTCLGAFCRLMSMRHVSHNQYSTSACRYVDCSKHHLSPLYIEKASGSPRSIFRRSTETSCTGGAFGNSTTCPSTRELSSLIRRSWPISANPLRMDKPSMLSKGYQDREATALTQLNACASAMINHAWCIWHTSEQFSKPQR